MNPLDLEQRLVELGHAKAEAKAKAYLLEQDVKAVRAAQYMKAREDGKTQGDAEQYALTTIEYAAALKTASEAMEAAEVAKVEHDALMAKFEAWRSLSASKREQIKQGVYQ